MEQQDTLGLCFAGYRHRRRKARRRTDLEACLGILKDAWCRLSVIDCSAREQQDGNGSRSQKKPRRHGSYLFFTWEEQRGAHDCVCSNAVPRAKGRGVGPLWRFPTHTTMAGRWFLRGTIVASYLIENRSRWSRCEPNRRRAARRTMVDFLHDHTSALACRTPQSIREATKL